MVVHLCGSVSHTVSRSTALISIKPECTDGLIQFDGDIQCFNRSTATSSALCSRSFEMLRFVNVIRSILCVSSGCNQCFRPQVLGSLLKCTWISVDCWLCCPTTTIVVSKSSTYSLPLYVMVFSYEMNWPKIKFDGKWPFDVCNFLLSVCNCNNIEIRRH